MKIRSLAAGFCLALIFVLLTGTRASAESDHTFTFPNGTGQAVNDLHIEFVQAVTPNPPGGPFGPFTNQSGGGTSKIDFSGGTVNAGGTTSIGFHNSGGNRITIKKWWWTKDGVRVGAIHIPGAIIMPSFDHDALRAGEISTVSLVALAPSDAAASFEVDYSITSPSGVVQTFPTISLAVAAGQEFHQQLSAGALTEAGTYTLHYTGVDEASGEVTEGVSTVTVDSGTRRRRD